jgi:hypothetical protein
VTLLADDQRLYGIVTPILYREPIVQDLGRLIRGIERPLPDGTAYEHAISISSDEDLPLHKLHALALIKKLHLVHASSRLPVTPHLRTTNKAYEFPSNETCQADALARIDLDGWEMTKSSTKRAKKIHGETIAIFQHVKHLSLGSWDDGRWTSYIVPNLATTTAQGTLPDNEILSLLGQYEPCLDILRFRHVCRRLRYGLYSLKPPNLGPNSTTDYSGLVISHATKISALRLYEPYAGPARVYIDIDLFRPYESDLDRKTEQVEPFKSYDWALYPISRARLSDEQMAKGKASVEFCIVSTKGHQSGLDLAVRVKEALEQFHNIVVARKGKDRLWKGEVKILVGDEIPVCPCCGTTA